MGTLASWEGSKKKFTHGALLFRGIYIFSLSIFVIIA
ncbi:hypothetical protein THOM_0948 [Trachipleistophora hominis]|uniref:Uncharacterized protein n=1 Tax=Trachipleistophora hominis TaxID=72359 RepID=L7JXN6_TRAHO|nr:hypothetical protein THOM_0948 [Trachipleistophora hominis]